ncbi:MAG: dTDP-glucose 4,6-dehydratase [Verrucomicrobiota bacterium]|nr:dTDP-glucose 4,6-dehydratase [Verrucomicrobiota bacterium]
MRILVTGGAGFIGSNFVRYMLKMRPDVEVANFDALTYAGNLENLNGLENEPRYCFVKGSVASDEDVEKALAGKAFNAIVNFAAETHVDRSLTDVRPFIRTNVVGAQVLLDACRKHGVKRFLQVSTDEVYGSLGPTGEFTESSPIQPNNPYAATKASADFLARAAHKSHGLDVAITRCSNNFGPYQFPEKLIPLMIANALEDKPLPVYGDGLHTRDWLYAWDHCSAIDLVLRLAAPGSVYNIGGHKDVPNIEVVKLLLKLVGKPESLIRFVQDRPGHDRRYAMNCDRIRRDLGWLPAHSFEDALRATVKWYLDNPAWRARARSGEYQRYYEKMYGRRPPAKNG